jgi:hypothetical protein
VWWKELGAKLEGLGFSKLHSIWGLYVRNDKHGRPFMMLLVYVDDFVIAARRSADIATFLTEVEGYWKLSDMGDIDNILGMKVVKDRSKRTMASASQLESTKSSNNFRHPPTPDTSPQLHFRQATRMSRTARGSTRRNTRESSALCNG